jgi:hypothetical protein
MMQSRFRAGTRNCHQKKIELQRLLAHVSKAAVKTHPAPHH